jgi:hypothetical protein
MRRSGRSATLPDGLGGRHDVLLQFGCRRCAAASRHLSKQPANGSVPMLSVDSPR